MPSAPRLVVLAVVVAAVPSIPWANSPSPKPAPPRRPLVRSLARSPSERPLTSMDLSPRDYLVRPYALPPPQAGDRMPTAVDYRFAQEGVMSFGYHRSSGAPSDPSGGAQPAAASVQPWSGVGAMVTYSFP